MTFKATVATSDLRRALDLAAQVISTKSTMPILGNVLLETREDGALAVVATDLDREIEIAAGGAAEGRITVDARKLRDLARASPDKGEVSLTAEGNTVAFASGRIKAKVPSLPADDFPRLRSIKEAIEFDMHGPRLAAAFGSITHAISSEETRYYLCGVNMRVMELDGTQVLRLTASDGHRLAWATDDPPEGSADMPGIILPSVAVPLFARLAMENETVRLLVSKSLAAIEADGLRYVTKLIDAVYPDADRVVPKPDMAEQTAILRRADMLAAVKTAVSMYETTTSNPHPIVKFAFGAEGLDISLSGQNGAAIEIGVDCELAGEPVTIGLNGRYVLAVLGAMDCDTVHVLLNGSGAPALFLLPTEPERQRQVIMPARAQ